MKMGPTVCVWTKEKINSDEKPVPRSQHIAIVLPKNDRMFMFGGHYDEDTRLNDTWIYTIKTFEWRRIGDEKDNLTNAPSKIGAPEPRANSSACIYEGKVYLFGGVGGLYYTSKPFNDLHCFDLETE
jgi:hypothetical protein